MSIIPLLFRDWWDDYDYTHSHPLNRYREPQRTDMLSNFWNSCPTRLKTARIRPWTNDEIMECNDDFTGTRNGGDSDVDGKIKFDKDKFQVILDVQQFLPKEIQIKISEDKKSIMVEGKHEEKPDEHGYISRYFKRRYSLPENINIDKIKSTLSSDGILSLSAPMILNSEIEIGKTERAIPIQHVGPAKIEDKKQKKID